MMAQEQQINSASYARIFEIKTIVETDNGPRKVKAMIDSGATGNFVSEELAKRKGFPRVKKKDPYDLVVVDGSLLPSGDGQVKEETTPLQVTIHQHQEEIQFDVVRMANHDIVLGIPWLRSHNPVIDWEKRVLRFERCSCVGSIQPTPRQRSWVDEKSNARRELAASKKDDQQSFGSDSPDTSKGQQGQEGRGGKENHEPFENPEPPGRKPREDPLGRIPGVYRRWITLFREEVTAKALPKHQPWDHEIRLEPGKQPTFGPIYALSEKELGTLRQYLEENEKKGFIKKSQSPAGYPILFVPKKDGTLRLCVDYRKLNDITVKNRYPLPSISELQDRLSGARYFTKLDLRGAYNLIRMKAGEEWKTAFRTRYGHYEYTVMPFGLTNAPATCQDMINDALREHLDVFVVAYLDDILVYSRTLEEHQLHVSKVLECLGVRDLRLKPEKCEFHQEAVDFLGFIVGRNGIRIDPTKLQAVREWKAPNNVKEVQSFLGFVNYNRKFIRDYSRRAIPLTNLTKVATTKEWQWGTKEQQAFEDLKRECLNDPVLKMFDTKKPSRIESDASDLAIGACLTQEHEGKQHPVAYMSRKLSPAEQNYDIHDKELLAIVAALETWRVYAEGSPGLTIYTDHKNLLHFTTTKQLNRRQVRWSELLGQYKFKIQYTPGKENGRADALSRRSDHMETKEVFNTSILKVNKDGSLSANQHELNITLRILRDDQEQFPLEKGKLQVPDAKIDECIREHHDGPLQGHPGVAKTIQLLRQHCQFPNMRQRVETYIKKCLSCQQNKHSTHARYGEIQYQEPPDSPWKEVTMDFIVKLPKSKDPLTKEEYDAILVIVDRLTKYSHLIPFKETYTAEQLGFVILDRLIRYHGIPEAIISDRDKLFTSNYWRTLIPLLGTKLKMSTAFHPTTDGQTERTNQTLEQYLRHYINSAQNNWVSLLPMAQLALSARESSTTKESPFFANFFRDPNLFGRELPHRSAESAIQKVETWKRIHGNITTMQQSSGTYQNKKRKMAPQLKKGDKVYLLTKNLKTRTPSKKLDHVKVGPFFIKEVKGPQNFELELPKDAKVHPVFHISLLEPADPGTPVQQTFNYETQEEDTFVVEKILKHEDQLYLVKWKGYPTSESTWEPREHLENCEKALQEFHRKEQEKSRTSRRKHSGRRPVRRQHL